MRRITKCALAVIRDKKLLVVREYGTTKYLMPGGRPKKRETAEKTLVREIAEELGANLDLSSIKYYGTFEDIAANEPNATIQISLYLGQIKDDIVPSSEIEVVTWVGSDCKPELMSPIIRNRIMPALVKDGLIQ